MTVEEAIARAAARWAPRAVVPADAVEERIAIRLEGEPLPVVRALPADHACRLFVQVAPDGGPRDRGRWLSAYVHELAEVDDVFARLEARARGAA